MTRAIQTLSHWLAGLPLGWLIDYRFLLLSAATLGLAAAVEHGLIGRGAFWRHRDASARRDAVLFAGSLVYHCVTRTLAAAGLWLTVRSLPPIGLSMGAWPLPVQLAVFVLGSSFIDYAIHRGQHHFRFWWALHEYHHSATTFAGVTNARGNVFEWLFLELLKLFPLALLGPAPQVFALAAAIFLTNNWLIHSEIDADYGWFGRWILISPNAHRLHHATDPQYHDVNVATDLVIWDRLFGSYRAPPPAAAAIPIGVAPHYNDMGIVEGSALGVKQAVQALVRVDAPATARVAIRAQPVAVDP